MKTRVCPSSKHNVIRPFYVVAVLCAILFVAVPESCPETIRLAEDGRAMFPVTIAYSAEQRVRETAEELAEYLGRISGAAFEVRENDFAAGIAVGVYTDFPDLKLDEVFDSNDPFRRDEYLLRTHADGILLIGATATAVGHAVWDLLHRLGYRLFFLTDTWEVVPRSPDLSVAVDVFESPDYINRSGPRGAAWSDRALWRRWHIRNRVTSSFTLRTGHAYGGIIRANRKAFEAHPEYFALVGGERRTAGGTLKFCVSNPGLRELVMDHAMRLIRDNPEQDSVSMDPSDGGGWCECEECAAMGSISDRAITLANEVAVAINQLGMGPKYVGIYAYNQHSPPPSIRVHPNVIVSVATSFIRGGYTIDELIEGWAEREAMLGIREYYDVFVWSHNIPRRARGGNIAYLKEKIPYFHEHGARFMNACGGDSWGCNGLGYWLSPILLWDVGAAERIDEYVDDFLEKAFGPAKKPMRDFFHLINMDRSLRTPEDVVGRMYQALNYARELTDAPDVRERLNDLTLYTRYVELYYQYRAASGDERQRGFEQVWRHVFRMQDRMMVSTQAICYRERFRDKSVRVFSDTVYEPPDKPGLGVTPTGHDLTADSGATAGAPLDALISDAESTLGIQTETRNPWESDAPFTEEELSEMIKAGMAANPITILDFEPVGFSEDLVPSAPLNLPETDDGDFSLLGRGTRSYLIWMDKPGEIEIQVTGGLITGYRDRGNVRISLMSPQEATMEPVDYDESVPPDGKARTVILKTPYEGLHTLEISDGGDRTDLVLPADLPVTVRSCLEERPPGLGSRWTLYFYVPRGTEIVGGYTSDLTGVMRDGDGNPVMDFSGLERPGYFSIPVFAEQSGRLWKVERSRGEKLLMTVPPYLARNARQLLLPRDVVKSDSIGLKEP